MYVSKTFFVLLQSFGGFFKWKSLGQHGKFIFSILYECTYQIVFHFTSSNDLSCQIGSVLYEFTIDKDVLLYVSEYV